MSSMLERGTQVHQRMLAERAARNGQVDISLPPEPPPPDDPYADVPPQRQPAPRPTVPTESLADLYQPIDWHELWATTSAEPDWLVPDILERGRLHSIYAPKKHKKSLLTLLMVASLATGGPLLGRPNPHDRPVPVLCIRNKITYSIG